MAPLLHSENPWKSVGYFQSFYCTAKSKDNAKKLVHQYFLEREDNPSACQFKFDRVAWMRTLTHIEDLKQGYDAELTEEMFANRNTIGIWYIGRKDYYVSEEDYAAAVMDEKYNESEEYDEDAYWNGFEGKCQSCDAYGPVDDMSLCNDCSGKLERDLIRQRAWDYSASAYGMSDESREKLREDVIKEYGKKLELIAPSPSRHKRKGGRKSKPRGKKK